MTKTRGFMEQLSTTETNILSITKQHLTEKEFIYTITWLGLEYILFKIAVITIILLVALVTHTKHKTRKRCHFLLGFSVTWLCLKNSKSTGVRLENSHSFYTTTVAIFTLHMQSLSWPLDVTYSLNVIIGRISLDEQTPHEHVLERRIVSDFLHPEFKTCLNLNVTIITMMWLTELRNER